MRQLEEFEVDTVATVRRALASPQALAQMEHPVAADCWCRPRVIPVETMQEVGLLYVHNYGPIA